MKAIKIFSIAVCSALLFASCGDEPTIDKEYNPVKIDVDNTSITGTFRQGDDVSGARIILSYENGLGRKAEAYLPEVNGISSDPVSVTLAERNSSNNGSGTIEIPLKGVPENAGEFTLRPTIILSTHEVFTEIKVQIEGEIVLKGGTVEGYFRLEQPIQNGKIVLNYTATKPQQVTIAVSEVAGIYATEFEATLPAAPDGGTFDIPLSGTPQAPGNRTLEVRVVKGSDEYTTSVTVNVKGDIEFDLESSYVDGDIEQGEEIQNTDLVLNYTSVKELDVTIYINRVEGIYADSYDTTIPMATNGELRIPLQGIPEVGGDITLTVTIQNGAFEYTAQPVVHIIPVEPVEFVSETIMYQGLEYRTVFVDLNGNGYVNKDEVWLDRNIGATSNDPNSIASYGTYYQYGVPYGSAYIPGYQIDFGAMTPWNICPDGYEVPTLAQWVAAFGKLIPNSTTSGNSVTGDSPVGETLKESVLRLPLVGSWDSGNPTDYVGTRGFYWTSTEGNNTAPWRVEINAANSTGGNWSGSSWSHPVRCIKSNN